MTIRHRTASADLEGLILAAALRLLDAKGVHALTVRGIASEAGIAPMGIYNRFDGKNGVYEALWVEGFERLALSMESTAVTNDVLDGLRQGGIGYREFALANTAHYRLMFMDTTNIDFKPTPASAAVAARALDVLVTRVEKAQLAGVVPKGPAIDSAQILWSAVHGFVSLELMNLIFAADHDAAYGELLTATLAGLAAMVP